MAANARLMELGNPVIRSESFNVCMTRDGRSLSWREGRAGEDVETVSKSDFPMILGRLMRGTVETSPPSSYPGRLFLRTDGTAIGLRNSVENGVTVDVFHNDGIGLRILRKVHQK